MDLRATVAAAGGFATTDGLRRMGVSAGVLAAAVRSGALRRVKRGCYTTRESTDPQVVAVAAGGRLTGVSGVEAMGGWMWRRDTRVHVSVAPNASRLGPAPSAVVLHWESPRVPRESFAICGLVDCLVRVALDADLESAAACFDWAFRAGRLNRVDFERILLVLPADARHLRDWVDPQSQSVLESVARVRLRRRGWAVRSQVRVGDLEAIDLVVEDHVALELDGREHHEATFERDRRKDLAIAVEGRHSLRISYSMLSTEWPRIERAIAGALRARRNGDAGFSGKPLRVPYGAKRTWPLPRFDA